MRLASVVIQANRPTRVRHGAGVSSGMADCTRKKSRCFAVCLGAAGITNPCCGGWASVSERDQAEQDRFHLVKTAHPAINAQPTDSLTGTYKNLSKSLRGNPREVSRFLHGFQAYISTYLSCYIVDTLCKPLFIKAVLHWVNGSQPRCKGENAAIPSRSGCATPSSPAAGTAASAALSAAGPRRALTLHRA